MRSLDIIVYNQQLQRRDMLVDKFSMIRNIRYNEPDTFQITTTLSKDNLAALDINNVIRLNNSQNLMYITNLEFIGEDGIQQLYVRGYGLEHYLYRRTIANYYYSKTTIVNHIKALFEYNVLKPSDNKRVIPNFKLIIDDSVGDTEVIPFQVDEDSDMLSVITELCKAGDLGYKVEYNLKESVAEFIIYKGKIKTKESDFYLPVIFSAENENILEQRLYKDNSEHKNVLLVIGSGEHDDKFTTVVGETDKSGLDRFEGFINAQDLDPDNQDESLTEEEYKELLKERGKIYIKNFLPLLTYESKIHPNSNLTYKKDFDIGDIVVVRNEEWEIEEEPRIVEVEEIYEDSFDIIATFGKPIPTASDKIKELEEEQKKDKSNSGSGGNGQEIDLEPIKRDIRDLQRYKADISEIERLESIIDNLDIPEDVDLEPIYLQLSILEQTKADTVYVDEQVKILKNIIENLDIPEEVDLGPIHKEIEQLKTNKANIVYVDGEIQRLEDIINSLDIPEEIDLTPIYKEIEQLKLIKADKTTLEKEIERLEKMIREIIEGEDSKYVIPRTTNNPIDQEIFYKQNTKTPPFVNWIEDDWGVWTKVSDKHLKTYRSGTYSPISGRVMNNEGTVKIDIKKKDQNHRHMLRQLRNGKNIFEVRETKKDKTYILHVKPGDTLTITSLFDGDVYLDYIGVEDDVRLSVYKNGVIEEVANKRKVEERLEDYTLKEELISKTGELDDLETKEKGNLVDAINEVNSKESSIIDSNTGDRYDIIAIDGKFYFERK